MLKFLIILIGLILLITLIKLKKSNKKIKEIINDYNNLLRNAKKLEEEHEQLTEKYNKFYEKYKDLIDLDEYKTQLNTENIQIRNEIEQLKKNYADKYNVYLQLDKQIELYNDTLELYDYGLYEPIFNFDTSEEYKILINNIKEKEKELIRNDNAVSCNVQWTVNGNKSEGNKQTKRYKKLMLRAFNGECDSLISYVKWNNIKQQEEKLHKSYEAINKMGETHVCYINDEYYQLKLKELKASYEYEEKKHQEKEEQRLIKEQIREEEKLQKEIEKKQKEIELQEKKERELQKAIEEAYKKGEKQAAEKAELEIAELKQRIEDDKRAVSQAQLTKSGYVYIISNIGSFGENIYKIGMTRRLNPEERIHELSSASVPFEFDIHAMISTENAPELEFNLHKYFDKKRVNLINSRKEFFNISLDEIEKYTKENNLDIQFTKLAEAKEYRQTMYIKNMEKENKSEIINKKSKLPSSIE